MTSLNKSIAIIDDDFLVRKSLERLLTAYGYGTESFATAEDFLQDVTACKADCLLIDLDLKSVSGLDLASHPSVRALERPFIFISGSASEEQRRQALELSGADCVRKPFKAIDLLTAIAQALRAA
jgi:FixJ family two-component response regulator